MNIDIYHRYELTINLEYSVNESSYRGEDYFVTYKDKNTMILYGYEFMQWLSERLTDDELHIINFKHNYIYLGYFNPHTGEDSETHINIKELPYDVK